MAKGFDCATPLTQDTALLFRADDFEFVCRYLVPSGWKRLTKEEAEAISAAGLQIVSVFETSASRALGGRNAGIADGTAAKQAAYTVGQPAGSRIYFAVDFDATPSQMGAVLDYIKAASEATPEFLTGVYGSAAVVEAAMSAGVCSGFWQTYAWSKGRKAEGVHIYQYDNGPKGLGQGIHGVNVDLDTGSADMGWWNTLTPVNPKPDGEWSEYRMNQEDANKIIGFLKAAYEAVGNKEGQAEFHRLAQELRKASGQPEEAE
jgi:hypothetical protein